MEYTITDLAKLAGISTRTLRFYDEIGLLKPAGTNHSGYRVYKSREVDRLQQILFYKELGVNLNKIKEIISCHTFDELGALREHLRMLNEKRDKLDNLIHSVKKTIAYKEGRISMTDKEKFESFKKEMIDENESKYGKEIRERYGQETVDKSYEKFKNMSADQYKEFQRLGEQIYETLAEAYETGDPAGELAQKAADLHRRWLCFTWNEYSKEAHAGLAQMYVDDERFKAYYDKIKPGISEFLRDAILIYTGMNKN
ncbi:MAG: MerR family transcriptional regulator [Eubacteriales bacterium]|jgi:DNA-binding transcriptional MerR regulator